MNLPKLLQKIGSANSSSPLKLSVAMVWNWGAGHDVPDSH